MKAGFTSRFSVSSVLVLAVFSALSLVAIPIAGQSSRETEGTRLLKNAIDMHFHMDAPAPGGSYEFADIADVKVAQSHGMRGLVIKNHWEPTATLAYLLRREIPNFDLFGGIVMNRTNGGMNVVAVEYMATQIRGTPGKIVWMPALESEIESRTSKQPSKPFVAVSRDGELLPETKAVISVVAKHQLILASGHIAPEEALLVFREGHSQGVQNMIATHAMDYAGRMSMDQMQEAVKLGAIIEFDFRNVLDEGGRRADAIRKLGPEHCFISEFWTNMLRKTPPPVQTPLEYAGLDGVGAFVEAMRSRGFTDHELDVMFKENPARLLGLSDH
jgi:Family of unknown function (DUF6282)